MTDIYRFGNMFIFLDKRLHQPRTIHCDVPDSRTPFFNLFRNFFIFKFPGTFSWWNFTWIEIIEQICERFKNSWVTWNRKKQKKKTNTNLALMAHSLVLFLETVPPMHHSLKFDFNIYLVLSYTKFW